MRRNKQTTTKGSLRFLTVVASLIMLVFGLYHIHQVVQSGNEEYGEITRIAQTAAILMDYRDLSRLNAEPEDTLKPEYATLKHRLMQIRRLNPTSSFVYIYTVRAGKVRFMVDSEPSGSPNCSPAGQEFTEATALDKALIQPKSKQAIEFSKDRWGDWVSILVPLNRPNTQEPYAVLGMDFDAKVWYMKRLKQLALAIMIVLLSLTAIAFIAIIKSKSQKLQRDFLLLKKTEMELLIAKEKAEESDRLKTSFLKNLSHEIRTPMNSILGFADLLKEQNLSAENKELYLNNMIISGQRMLNTIYDIIDLSRVQNGEVRATIVRANMGDLLFRMRDQFGEPAKEKNLELICTITDADKNLFFYTDTHLLHAILEKLMWNAIKFTSKGFVKMEYRRINNLLEFCVSDSGVGIDEEQKAFIFDFFRQGNDSLSRSYEGNGLGLSIAKAYVSILGGTITVESTVGKGSSFLLSIPFYEHKPILNA